MTLATMQMQKCVSGCGALVRDGGYCTECEQLAYDMEAKRMRDIERNRRYGVGQPQVSEHADLPTILAATSVRERVAAVGLCVLGLAVGTGAALLFWMGLRQAVEVVIRWGG